MTLAQSGRVSFRALGLLDLSLLGAQGFSVGG